ncbi:MAG: zinc-dependent metalloprotease family protein [Rhodothermales bacterium]
MQLAIDQINLTYENSKIDHRLRLAGTEEIAYTQHEDMSEDLYRLQSPDDGFMDDVHALRDDYQADIVSLWVGDASNYCGFGYIMTDLDLSFEGYAFNVTRVMG